MGVTTAEASKGRVPVDERPGIVDERSRIGDWEAGTVIGKPGGAVLVTLAERKSRLSIIAPAPNKTAQAVKEPYIQIRNATQVKFVTLAAKTAI